MFSVLYHCLSKRNLLIQFRQGNTLLYIYLRYLKLGPCNGLPLSCEFFLNMGSNGTDSSNNVTLFKVLSTIIISEFLGVMVMSIGTVEVPWCLCGRSAYICFSLSWGMLFNICRAWATCLESAPAQNRLFFVNICFISQFLSVLTLLLVLNTISNNISIS